MKYIKINTAALGDTPIVFPEAIQHSEMARRISDRQTVEKMARMGKNSQLTHEIQSAGFCYLRDDLWTVPLNRGSVSLGIAPDIEDEFLLNAFMRPMRGMLDGE